MQRTTTLVVDDSCNPVVRHVAPPGPAAEALRHEASVLRRARGLGLVELTSSGDEPDGTAVLATRYVAGGTLADVARDHGDVALVAVLASVARILARLHAAGIVHGRCTADHVVGDGEEVALCGLSQARTASGDEVLDTSVDTEGFALLAEQLCSGGDDVAQRARLAVRGLTELPPTTDLRSLSAELGALAGLPPVTGPVRRQRVLEPRRPPDGSGSARGYRAVATGRAARAVAAGVVLLGVALVGAAALTGADSSAREAASGEARGAAPAPSSRRTDTGIADASGPRPSTTVPASAEATEGAGPSADGSSGAGEQVWPAPPADAPAGGTGPASTAGVVEHEGVRYQVGAVGDLVAIGDWDCDGLATPSVVRPSDGTVWTFPSWAGDGEVAVADPSGTAPSPVAATAVPADGCDALAITSSDGREVVIRPG